MRVKLFTLRYSATLGGFDETPLAEFFRDREALAFREHFFSVNEVPHLVCIVCWQDAVVREEDLAVAKELRRSAPPDPSRLPIPSPDLRSRESGRRKRRSAPDPTEGLDERERVLFNTLREWRAAKAKEEGVPPYLVFTNKHFVEMVTKRPDSPTALAHLHGVGPGKVKRYAEEVLKLLAEAPPGERMKAQEKAAEAPR